MKKLTKSEQAAKIFLETKPTMSFYSHIVTKGLNAKQDPKIIIALTPKAGYTGLLIMDVARE